MIKISLLFFGIATDLVGNSSLTIAIASNTSVQELRQLLTTKFPNLKQITSYAIAVNEEYASKETILTANDTVAIIPPVSGG
ncbi:molybdopterin converting factor subunit 1 [Tenacibaculum maritimum]|uniref:molybdopterin converting factor subunit 1 n=1 Tax=Tenacibaculum maritimum TaxID=107401 RepID=UPI0012E6706F|nr:molybdopterin converting factor subunit 1 [Tenacibaculum maritimum]MDB0601200.1 molybdopterin converting factor subunit 1 [Tenacibaculum maritimum]MDB0613549.1 molybdopterin converting factor subunit 1 [Tenacibaculum maritimum]CAA0156836.1 Molybdopterin synthase, small subunit (sulfur carrier) [Tenacibaculum maritimum]